MDDVSSFEYLEFVQHQIYVTTLSDKNIWGFWVRNLSLKCLNAIMAWRKIALVQHAQFSE